MPRVICTLPNASDCINGIRFSPDRGQMVSDEVDEATAARFAAIDGYLVVAPEAPQAEQTESTPAPATAPATPEPPPSDAPASTRRAGGKPKPAAEAPAVAPAAS